MEIRRDDLSNPTSRNLVQFHFSQMQASSPPCAAHVVGVENLSTPETTVFTAWEGSEIMGIGALKELNREVGEIKSMRTHPDHLRKGVGAAILERIIVEARKRGLQKLSLETGSGSAFEPAIALYKKHGFLEGERFAQYKPNGFSRFFHLRLG